LREPAYLSGEAWTKEKRKLITKHSARQRAFAVPSTVLRAGLCPLAPRLASSVYGVRYFFLERCIIQGRKKNWSVKDHPTLQEVAYRRMAGILRILPGAITSFKST
jgi:hypothetical protein